MRRAASGIGTGEKGGGERQAPRGKSRAPGWDRMGLGRGRWEVREQERGSTDWKGFRVVDEGVQVRHCRQPVFPGLGEAINPRSDDLASPGPCVPRSGYEKWRRRRCSMLHAVE